MKSLLTLIFLIIPLLVNCQVYQVTGKNLQPVMDQCKKSNDSLKIAISNNLKAFNTWQNWANAQMKTKSDSIKLLKTQLIAVNKTNDSLKLTNYNINHLFANSMTSQSMDTIQTIEYLDTTAGIISKITEKTFSIIPKFIRQVSNRYAITTPQGIKMKEVTITELKP